MSTVTSCRNRCPCASWIERCPISSGGDTQVEVTFQAMALASVSDRSYCESQHIPSFNVVGLSGNCFRVSHMPDVWLKLHIVSRSPSFAVVIRLSYLSHLSHLVFRLHLSSFSFPFPCLFIEQCQHQPPTSKLSRFKEFEVGYLRRTVVPHMQVSISKTIVPEDSNCSSSIVCLQLETFGCSRHEFRGEGRRGRR